MKIAPRVNHDYEGDIKALGDTVNIQSTSNYTAATKSASTDVTFEAFTHAQVQLVVNTHQYAAVKIERIAEKQALNGYREKQTHKLGYALGRAVDVALSAIFDGFGDNGTFGVLGLELTDNEYLAAYQKLMEAGAMEEDTVDEAVSIFLSPAAYVAALKLDKFVSRDYVSDPTGTSRGGLPTIYGGRVYMTNLLESDSAGQHDCAFMHRDALALAMQQAPTVETDYLVYSIANVIVADQFYGVKELTWPQEGATSVTMTDNRGCYLATV